MRIKRLDVLRAIAVLFVLFLHADLPFFRRMGWTGVDLFFVLSGFLISGLLFSEYKKRGSISFKRFFIRRGLKIYPSFYLMIAMTVGVELALKLPLTVGDCIREVFFVQNYSFGIWAHTWSLAIEEHFYIVLPMLLLFLTRISRDRTNPFRAIPWVFGFVAAACLVLRAATIYLNPTPQFRWEMVANPTHERIDSLFFGVLLSYLQHFHTGFIEDLLARTRNRIVAGLLIPALLWTCFFLPHENHFLLTFGLTFLYLGFGLLLILNLQVRDIFRGRLARSFSLLGTGLAYIGMYSYSIYLWHLPFVSWAPGVLRRLFDIRMNHLEFTLVFIFGGIVFGIAMSKLIEYPVLRVRDRIFPAMQGLATGRADAGREGATTSIETPAA
ncbi:MAG TPA: acyltransferase [Candidatus Acidoferrales bacterium]|nr:acyltransferase [Candidatus Acidoferrales bacterium]